MRFHGPRYAVVATTILLLLTVTRPLVAAAFDGVGSYSGDDEYDPAAGGRPPLSAVAPAAGAASPVGCGLSIDEIAERSAMTIAGGSSGDDDYDPPSGGTPELSLLVFANAPSPKAACEVAVSGN